MNRWIVLVIALLCSSTAGARESMAQIRQSAEASMLLNGSIEINPDGSVHQFSLDQAGSLPPAVVELLDKTVPHWKFELTSEAGPPQILKTDMSVRVVADRRDADSFRLSVRGASFANHGDQAYDKNQHAAPSYPREAISARLEAMVYLLLKIDEQGKVVDGIAEQVNLGAVDSASRMDRWRKLFADATLRTALHWTLDKPEGVNADRQGYWYARVPVSYNMTSSANYRPSHGSWDVYIPGPRQPAPWGDQQLLSDGSDAISDGAIHALGTGPRLLNRLDPG